MDPMGKIDWDLGFIPGSFRLLKFFCNLSICVFVKGVMDVFVKGPKGGGGCFCWDFWGQVVQIY